MVLFWILLVACVVIVIQGLLYHFFALRGLDYTASFSTQRAFAGDSIEFRERIRNRKWLPLPWVRLEQAFDLNLVFQRQSNLEIIQGQSYHQFHRSIFSLLPYLQVTRRHQMICQKRGVYTLSSAMMTCGDLFGLKTTNKRIPLSFELLVYPQLLSFSSIPLPAQRWLGEVMVRRWVNEDPFLVSGVRPYQPGDELKLVNWKATARSGELRVHKRDFTADYRLFILLNMEDSEDMWSAITEPELIEHGISLCASIAHFAMEGGAEVGFGCNGSADSDSDWNVKTPVAAGSFHLETILETMARLKMECRCSFATLMQEHVDDGRTHLDYLLVTTYINEKILELSHQLRMLGNTVEVLPLELPLMDGRTLHAI